MNILRNLQKLKNIFKNITTFRVVKLIALEFVNNFLSLFYIAFWLRDINLIRSQLMTQLIVFQVMIFNECFKVQIIL